MRTLVLNRETVRALNETQLGEVNGLSGATCPNSNCCQTAPPCNTFSCNGTVCSDPTDYTCATC